MVPKLTADMIVLWTGAIIFALAYFLFRGLSVRDNTWRDTLGGCVPPLLLIVAAIVLTVLRCSGIVGPFFGRY